MGALLFCHFRVINEVDKLKKFIEYYSFKMTWAASFFNVFLYSLLCFKYICDIYLSNLDFNGLRSATNGEFNNVFIYKITEDIQ